VGAPRATTGTSSAAVDSASAINRRQEFIATAQRKLSIVLLIIAPKR